MIAERIRSAAEEQPDRQACKRDDGQNNYLNRKVESRSRRVEFVCMPGVHGFVGRG